MRADALIYLENKPSEDKEILEEQIKTILKPYHLDNEVTSRHIDDFTYDYIYDDLCLKDLMGYELGSHIYNKPMLAKHFDIVKHEPYVIVLNENCSTTWDRNKIKYKNLLEKIPTMSGWVVLIMYHS